MELAGGCHCGAHRFVFSTEAPLAPRACQCGFCRRHGARSVSDPAGIADFSWGADLVRYRFAAATADYLLCGRCGTYLGAVALIDGVWVATLNLNAIDAPHLDLTATPVSYDGEDLETKADRRRRRWTPVRSGSALQRSARATIQPGMA